MTSDAGAPTGLSFDSLPSECLVDKTLEIRVHGAHAGEAVTLTLASRFYGQVLRSEATFTADDRGLVDVSRQAPVSGTYAGVDAMGLFWSRAPVADERAAAMEAVSDDPFTTILRAQRAGDGAPISHAIRRVYAGPEVASRAVDAQGLVGMMFVPAGAGPHAAVLVVGGSGGGLGWSREMAALLASHGFAALALAYFAAEGLPATLDRIPLEYFGSALEWLARQPEVDATRIGLVGASRGGELALLLGATFPQVSSVVAYVASGILWGAYPGIGHGAWTLGGQEIPYAKTLGFAQWEQALAEGRAREGSFDWYFIPLQHAAYAERASIAVERINGPVLMISGADDRLWPSSELTEFAVRRLQEKNFPHPFRHLRYEGAGHSIASWPHGPTTVLRSVHPVSGEPMDMGGTPEATAHARVDSWERVLRFLRGALHARSGDPG